VISWSMQADPITVLLAIWLFLAFYLVCHCGDFLEYASGSYYCVACHMTVFSATSRWCFEIYIAILYCVFLCFFYLLISMLTYTLLSALFKLVFKTRRLLLCYQCQKVCFREYNC
jgi:hypothetical protein